jgi:hypothetical protein
VFSAAVVVAVVFIIIVLSCAGSTSPSMQLIA